jgi:hypothetical protein
VEEKVISQFLSSARNERFLNSHLGLPRRAIIKSMQFKVFLLITLFTIAAVILVMSVALTTTPESAIAPETSPTPDLSPLRTPSPMRQAMPTIAPANDIPSSVLQKYESYENPLSIVLYKCLHESQTIYEVVFHSGFTVETNQYNSTGTLLGQGYWSDDGTSNKEPPITLQESDCQVVSEKKNRR